MLNINILLVDDHCLVRTGLRKLLEDSPSISVMGEAKDGEEAINIVKENKPDVIMMDVNMPGMGGLEATRKLLQIDPELKIIVVTVYGEEPFPTQLLKAGARGYLTKSCGVEEMIKGIKRVYDGQRYISMDVAQHLAMTMLPGVNNSPLETLSQRELQVMLMLTRGLKVQEISDRLCLSPKTVSTYRYRLFDKLGVDGDVELTHMAMRHGMLDSGIDSDAI